MVAIGTLLERCRRGDPLAWEALVRRFQARVYGMAFHYVRSVEEARDLAQDIFIRIYERLDSAPDGDAFVPWMLRLSRNLSIDRLRRIKARPPAEDVAVDDGAVELRALEEGPESSWLRNERCRLVYEAMGKLSEPAREVLLLKDIEGLSVQEISAVLDAPVGTVKSRAHRARLELAQHLLALDPSLGTG